MNSLLIDANKRGTQSNSTQLSISLGHVFFSSLDQKHGKHKKPACRLFLTTLDAI